MSIHSLPALPPLPPDATFDQQMFHASMLMRAAEYEQQERNIAATERSIAATWRLAELHERSIATTGRLADVQARSADAVERTMTEGLPSDQPMVNAILALRDAIAGAGGGRIDHLVRLLSTMTSQRRQNPATAAAAAAAELAAIEARG